MTTPAPTSVAYYPQNVGALVWVFLTIYLMFVLSLAAYGYYKSAKITTIRGKIEDHFVASRGLGLTVLALTVFATVFSGYTVVGVPAEVWGYGFFGFRWLFTISMMGYPMMFLASRLHTLAHARNYVSPTDFVKDRYGSWSLTWFTSLSMVFPAIVYAMAQFISMGATIQGMSDGKIDDFHAACILCIIMIVYEIFGGLRAIAYTDVIQGSVLIVAFLLFYIAQKEIFGGVEEASRFMAANSLNVMLSKSNIQSWVGFGMVLCTSYAFYPQIIIRSQAAKNGTVIKWTYIFLIVGTWIAMTCSLFTGMVANLYLGRAGDSFSDANAVFGLVVKRAIIENAGYNILGSLMLTASAAAFMSTADSAINACVSLLTLDFLEPLIPDTWTSKQNYILYGGKLLSIAIALVALFCSRIEIGLGALLTLQGMVLCQVAPAYVMGFFNLPLHAYPVLMGQVSGIAISIGYQCSTKYCVQSSVDVSWFGPWEGIQPGFFALLFNILVVSVGCFIWPVFDIQIFNWDKVHITKFEEDIPKELLTLKADGVSRPWSHYPWNILFAIAFILHCFTTPWWLDFENPQPDLTAGSFPDWVWGCGAFRLVGDILVLVVMVFGWQDKADGEEGEQSKQTMEMGTPAQQTDV